jgi:hypothetical protein
MLVSYGVTVKASMSRDKKGNVEYDAIAPGKKEFDRAAVDASAMLKSVRLSPGPLPR